MDSLKMELTTMEDGETKACPCPFCNAQHEDKLYLTKTGSGSGVYICHRASCGAKGGIGDRDITITSKPKRTNIKLYSEETTALTDSHKEYLNAKFELQDYTGITYEPRRNALVFQLQTAERTIWGTQIKRQWGVPKGSYKCCTYQCRDAPKIHYAPPIGRGRVVLVEDFLSAKKLSRIVPTCAILGTHMLEEVAVDLHKYYDHLVLALDYDAVDKMRKIKAQWSCVFDIDIVIMKKDVKDTPYTELNAVFK